MDGALGDKIGEGATADVHAWAPGRVVKLFRPGFERLAAHEARTTRAVHAASGLAPEVFGERALNGRSGILMARLEGPSLLELTKAGQVTYAEAGASLARSLFALHCSPPAPALMPLRAAIDRSLAGIERALGPRVQAGIRALLARLSPGDGLCHGDPNPGNLIMTPDGPRLIDWIAALRAPPAFDLASAHVLLAEIAPHVADDPERPRAINAALQANYAELSGASPAAHWASVEPYLPIVRVHAYLGGGAARAIVGQRLASDFAD